MSINIIQAIQDKGFFYDYLVGNAKSLQSWSNWLTLLRVIYGLNNSKKSAFDLIKLCTGRDPDKLSADGYKNVLLLVGRRGGKSKICGMIAAFEAALSGKEDVLSAGEMGLVSVISPTRFQSQIVKSYIRACFDSPLLSEEITQEDRDGFELSNGIKIAILTGDYKAVRGFTQLCVIIEEINFFCISEESKVRSATELINAILPSLATTGGRCIAISTKYRKSGWGFNTWRRCFKNDSAATLVWEAPSRLMNKTLSQEVIDEAIVNDRSSANSEYLNSWREDIEQFLPIEVIQSNVIVGRKQLMPMKYKYFAFTDCSGGRNDSAALAIAHLSDDKSEKGLVVLDFLKQYKAPHSPSEVVVRQAIELKKFGLNRVTGDSYSAQWVVDSFKQNNGIIYEKSKLNKSQLFLEILPRLCSPNGIELLDDDGATVKQFALLERKTKSGGRDSIGCPNGSGFFDDICNVIAGVSFISSEKKKRAGVFLTRDPRLDEMSNARILSSIY